MQLQGLHHITMITGDAQRNVDFYAHTLGLRLIKQTVNFDQPEAYHLYFGDEAGSPGSILTWFEFAGAAQGRAGAGMVHTLELGVPSEDALEFWAGRLEAAGTSTGRETGRLRFADPDGLDLALVISAHGDPPLQADHPEVPAEHAILGADGARAYAGADLDADRELLTDTLGFTAEGDGAYLLDGGDRHFHWAYDAPPGPGRQGSGTVHHIAWHSRDEDHEGWRATVGAAGQQVTPVIDRDYFNAIYFREPQGVLFEIATTSPGFATDEQAEHLGESLQLPAQHEHLRDHLEHTLTPLVNPRTKETA